MGKYSIGHSRDSHLDSTLIDFGEADVNRYDNSRAYRSPVSPPPPMGHRGRSKSGVWDQRKLRSPVPPERPTLEKKLITMSAPDLLEALCCGSEYSDNSSGYGGSMAANKARPPKNKSFTLGAPQSHRTVQRQLSRSNSRNKIRC